MLSLTILYALSPVPSLAIYTLQTTLSSGYYRTQNQKKRLPTLLNWNLNHTASNEIETAIDLGADNSLFASDWSFQVYVASITLPLSHNSDLPLYRRPQLSIGRMMLTEGFELSSLDGAQLPYSFTESIGLMAFAGVLRDLEDHDLRNDPKIFGSSIYGYLNHPLGRTQYRGGYIYKEREDSSPSLQENFAHGTLYHDFLSLPSKPLLLLKGQWNLNTSQIEQFLTELELKPHSTLNWVIDYSSLQPTLSDAGTGLFIYRLFSLTSQEQVGTHFTWIISTNLSLSAGVKRMSFDSSAGPEVSDQENIHLDITSDSGKDHLSPSYVHLRSYGGNLSQFGLRYIRAINDLVKWHTELNLAKIDKVNGIYAWAYHGRGGISFNLSSKFMIKTLLELERNQIFKIDARAVAYVSHFLY